MKKESREIFFDGLMVTGWSFSDSLRDKVSFLFYFLLLFFRMNLNIKNPETINRLNECNNAMILRILTYPVAIYLLFALLAYVRQDYPEVYREDMSLPVGLIS